MGCQRLKSYQINPGNINIQERDNETQLIKGGLNPNNIQQNKDQNSQIKILIPTSQIHKKQNIQSKIFYKNIEYIGYTSIDTHQYQPVEVDVLAISTQYINRKSQQKNKSIQLSTQLDLFSSVRSRQYIGYQLDQPGGVSEFAPMYTFHYNNNLNNFLCLENNQNNYDVSGRSQN